MHAPDNDTSTTSTTTTDTDAIDTIARAATRAGLSEPLLLLLGIVRPVDFISSQMVQFVQPFVRGWRWEPCARALTHEAAWQQLRAALSGRQRNMLQ